MPLVFLSLITKSKLTGLVFKCLKTKLISARFYLRDLGIFLIFDFFNFGYEDKGILGHLDINRKNMFVLICFVFGHSKSKRVSFVLIINTKNSLAFISFVFKHLKTKPVSFVLLIKQIKTNGISFYQVSKQH